MNRMLRETASQTAGPYVHIGLAPESLGQKRFKLQPGNVLVSPQATGEHITIEGRVLDGSGSPVRDAVLELWQADAEGRYAHPADPRWHADERNSFKGWGRTHCDCETGVWSFRTVKPGVARGRDGIRMAPHISIWLVARGINLGLNTRIYFEDETEANALDPVLKLIDDAARRSSLLAARILRNGTPVYQFDIRLQGAGETVFLDI